jgi:hypothetical protein
LCGRTTIKKCCGDKLVLGFFFGLGFGKSAGCVRKSTGKYWIVLESTGKGKKSRKNLLLDGTKHQKTKYRVYFGACFLGCFLIVGLMRAVFWKGCIIISIIIIFSTATEYLLNTHKRRKLNRYKKF